MKIAIGVPTNRQIKAKMARALMELVARKEHEYEIIVSTRGYNTSENRNYIAAQAVKKGCDYLFFVDDDVIIPPDSLEKLLSSNQKIIGGIYNTKYEKQEPVIEYLDDNASNTSPFECKALGTGCLLIHREVFETLPQPWFKYEWYDNGMVKRSHDWIFCEDARKAGFEVWADPRLEVKHIGKYEYR